jgi:hypothetical protein
VFAEYYEDNVDEMISIDKDNMDRLVLFVKEAEYKVSLDGNLIYVNGETNLPDETELWVFIKRKDKLITGTSVNVIGNKFSCVLGPFSKKFYLGIYRVEVSFIPRRQNLKVLAELKQELTGKELTVVKELQIGEKEEIILQQKEIIKSIKESVDKVEMLYESLKKSIKAYQDKEITKFQWNTWAAKWNKALDVEKDLNANRSEGMVVALFPKAEDELGGVIGQIWLLEKLYEKQMQGKKTGMFDPKTMGPKISSSLEDIKYMLTVDFVTDKDDDDDEGEDKGSGVISVVPGN